MTAVRWRLVLDGGLTGNWNIRESTTEEDNFRFADNTPATSSGMSKNQFVDDA
jgi:hypothetical protein